MFKIFGLVILILIGVVVGYLLGGKNLTNYIPDSKPPVGNTATNNDQSRNPTQTIGDTSPGATKGWKTYISKADNVKFDFPDTWALTIKKNPYLAKNPDSEDFSLNTFDTNTNKFQVNLTLTAEGVGGACPDFDPSKQVVSSKQINILNQNLFLIYLGDKKVSKIDYAYVNGTSTGECPNVAFVQIKGLPGLFAASFGYQDPTGKIKQMETSTMLNDPNVQQAEKILQSIKFSN